MKNAYSEQATADRYDSARLLPAETMTMWLAEIASIVPQQGIERILDLGCGTGRFTAKLAEAFGCTVVGVEPSEAMLAVAELSEQPPQNQQTLTGHTVLPNDTARRISAVPEFKRGVAEEIPLADESVDLVFMSQVFHHLVERSRALQEIHRVLRPAGYLVIRNGMREENKNLAWLEFFPAARVIEDERTPARAELKSLVCDQPFTLVSARIIQQRFASSTEEYFEKISGRALSSLIAISDDDFAGGLARFRDWADLQPRDVPVFEPVDLFIFQKEPAALV